MKGINPHIYKIIASRKYISLSRCFIKTTLISNDHFSKHHYIFLADFITKLKQYRKNPQHFGRIIEVHDFMNASMILRSGYADFHNERIPSLFLTEEQKRPDKGQYQKSSMLVVSKIDVLAKLKQPFTIEQQDRQVFHEFEKDAEIGKINYYKLHKGADASVNIIATDAEMKYCNDNFKEIKKMRERQLVKDLDLCKSDSEEDEDVKMPLPSHLHCGICRCNYEDFQQHIESQEHKSQITVHKNFYEFIDRELDDLFEKSHIKQWKTSPLRVKMPQPEKLVSVVKPLLEVSRNDDTGE